MLNNKGLTSIDLTFLDEAIKLANAAQEAKNLPIGAVITLENKIIGRGKNTIWSPSYTPNRHAEIEAIKNVSPDKWEYATDMTLYTTLEPCLMCLGTILIYKIRRIIFGANDTHGGALCVFEHMPPAFKNLLKETQWIGPVSEECKELSEKVIDMAKSNPDKKYGYSSLWAKVESDN